jgi:hypothetical protein
MPTKYAPDMRVLREVRLKDTQINKNEIKFVSKIKFPHNRPRWTKGYRVG